MQESAASAEPTGNVVLDIGGDVGALVVTTDAALLGREVEVSPVGHDHRRVHADVLARQTNGELVYAVVIGGLRSGPYRVWKEEDVPWGEVEISGGAVTQIRW